VSEFFHELLAQRLGPQLAAAVRQEVAQVANALDGSRLDADADGRRKENFELRRANAILKDASVYFAQELDPTRRR